MCQLLAHLTPFVLLHYLVKTYALVDKVILFTAQCTIVQSMVLQLYVVRLSVCLSICD